ncbi:MAG: HAMP domain-containing sensor histidine kinase [Pseudohongiellaceae bacterium]
MRFRPRSILQLTVTGFLAVTGLLIIALLVTARQLSGLSETSQLVVNQHTRAVAASRTLMEQSTGMERNVKQYNITSDSGLLDLYVDRRRNFAGAANELLVLDLSEDVSEFVTAAVALETDIFTIVSSASPMEAELLFPQLTLLTAQISGSVNEWSNTQVASIPQEAENTQRLLTFQAILLVSAALILAGVFTALITRPLIQIEKAIGQLGSGAYDETINIKGPRDLESLGRRLDWLRGRLSKLEQQRSSFLRHVSHELKTPLAAIQESSSLLSDGVMGALSEQQREVISIQHKNSHRLQALIDDLLRHNTESFSLLNVMPGPVRLDKVVDRVITAHELTAKPHCLIINKKLARITINGDYEQLRVAVDNLLGNAVKFSPDGGVIEVHLFELNGNAVLEVIDQGPGIKAEETDRIFEAFYQGTPPQKPAYKGSGLGLAITQEYVQANRGHIQIVDVAAGACFRVEFPTNKNQES